MKLAVVCLSSAYIAGAALILAPNATQVDPYSCVWKLRSGTFTSSAFAVAHLDTDTLLATCKHSIAHDREDIQVRLPSGETFRATIHAEHPTQDLALVRIEGRWPLIELSRKVQQVGDVVVSVGYPMARDLTICEGRYCGEDRISANVDMGSSGGPILNSDGEAVGVAQQVMWKWVGPFQTSVPWMGRFVPVASLIEML